MGRYYHVTDNEWIEIVKNNFRLICCSCNLVHDVDFKIVKGKLFAKFCVNNRSTDQMRKKK